MAIISYFLTLNVKETFLFFLMRFRISVARNWTQNDDRPNSRSILNLVSPTPGSNKSKCIHFLDPIRQLFFDTPKIWDLPTNAA